jgi:uncharacterized protein (DUF2141 family)
MSALFFFGSLCSASATDVSVVVSGIVPDGTNVYVALCTGALEPGACGFGEKKAAQASTMKFVLRDVPPARYAVAAFQDVNGSGSMERSQLGIPLEPYAFSNDAGRSRKPTFETAAITIGPTGRDFQLRLRGIRPAASQ